MLPGFGLRRCLLRGHGMEEKCLPVSHTLRSGGPVYPEISSFTHPSIVSLGCLCSSYLAL